MKRVLILGGGFGGLKTAHTLRQLRPDDEIVVVDRATQFLVGFRKTWSFFAEASPDAGRGQLADLEKFGISFCHGTVTKIEPEARAIEVGGERMVADAFVIALGARLAPEETPGFSEHGLNIYDPTAIPEVRQALRSFRGGRILVSVLGLPYKCPPAPYEIAILTKEYLRQRGVEATVEVSTPLPMSLPIVGEVGCGIIEGHLAQHGVNFLPVHTVKAVEQNEVVFENERRPFDLLFGIAAHRCPQVVVESGLAGAGGWVQVDPRTLETRFADVYAIGDVATIPMANGKPLPMAGVFAEGEGEVVARRIAARFDGREPDATFEGKGGCFLEIGNGQAMMVQGQFLAEPAPQVTLSESDAAYLQQKEAFEQERLQEWFGIG